MLHLLELELQAVLSHLVWMLGGKQGPLCGNQELLTTNLSIYLDPFYCVHLVLFFICLLLEAHVASFLPLQVPHTRLHSHLQYHTAQQR